MKKSHFLYIASFFFLFGGPPFVQAQFQFQAKDAEQAEAAADVGGPRLGASQSQIWKAGIVIEPEGSQAENVFISLPIPMDWPEQKVLAVKEEKSDISISGGLNYRVVNNGVKELYFKIDKIRSNRKIEVIVAVELLNFELLPPENPDNYVIPKRLHRDVEQYVKKSPCIESDNQRFLKMFNELTKDKPSDWEKVEAIYSFVQRSVSYDETAKTKIARGAFAMVSDPEGQWKGDCKDMSCLFVAICRAGKVPARLVRLPEHCYAEFYLEPKEVKNAPIAGKQNPQAAKRPTGFWFPCQVAGTYSFGGIPERQPILQKGDSYPDKDSENKKAKYIFLKEYLEASERPGKFQFIHNVQEK